MRFLRGLLSVIHAVSAMPPYARRGRSGLSGRGRLWCGRLSLVWRSGRLDLRWVRSGVARSSGKRWARFHVDSPFGSTMAGAGTVRALLAPGRPQWSAAAAILCRLRSSVPCRRLCAPAAPSPKAEARTDLRNLWRALRASPPQRHLLLGGLSAESLSAPDRERRRPRSLIGERLGPVRRKR
jgi:hypothetical protein